MLDTLLARSPVDGVVRLSALPESWGTGDGFRIGIEDSDGRFALGQRFQICGSDPMVEVSYPTTGTVFTHGGDILVEWRCAEGVVVDIFVYDGPDRIDTFRRGAGNSGFAARPIPPDWGTGDGYRLEVVDTKGVSGFSETFVIESGVDPGRSHIALVNGSSFAILPGATNPRTRPDAPAEDPRDFGEGRVLGLKRKRR